MMRQDVHTPLAWRRFTCVFNIGKMTENGTKYDFDLLVIGAGSGGTRAARWVCELVTLAPPG
jgi:hypothetical protein